MDISFGIHFFGALFAIMNPLVALPLFLSLTSDQSPAEQRRTALGVTLTTTVMCAVIVLAGQQILNLFGISIDAFRLAGGLVLVSIAWHMLNGSDSASHSGSESEKSANASLEQDSIVFYPMTFPMLVGPGTITTLLVFSHQIDGSSSLFAFVAVIALIIAMLGLTFWFSASIGARLTHTLRVIMTRLMGMILLAISVGMAAEGAAALLPGLKG